MINPRTALHTLSPYTPGKPISEVQSEFGLTHITKLASNENPCGCSPHVTKQLQASLDTLHLYPDGNCTALREGLARQLAVSPDSLLFGCGTDEVISLLAAAYIDPNDEAITAATTFPQYASAVTACGGTVVATPMKNHAYDLHAILAAVTDKTRIIFIANPNNPTGTAFFSQEQKEFLAKVPPHILVVLDEAYYEYVGDPDFPDSIAYLSQYENVVVLRTFSKIYGLAALRVGYGIMHPAIAAQLNKIRKPFNVSTLAQQAALTALQDQDFVQKSFLSNQEAKRYTMQRLDEMGLFYIPPHGNFILLDTKANSTAVFSALLQKGVIVRPGAAFGMNSFLRVTLGTVTEMKIFFTALAPILHDLP